MRIFILFIYEYRYKKALPFKKEQFIFLFLLAKYYSTKSGVDGIFALTISASAVNR